MATRKLTVVISQSQSKNPQKKELEQEIAARLLMEASVEVGVVPHLYDMHADHTGMLFLKSIPGDLVVLSWLYPRATRWILHRQGIAGKKGQSLLIDESNEETGEENDHEQPDQHSSNQPNSNAGVGRGTVPDRFLYCIDLKVSSQVDDYIEEIKRIAREQAVETIDLTDGNNGKSIPIPPQQQTQDENTTTGKLNDQTAGQVKRRWYPVIDYERCTNCLECIDFCLFGVYGVNDQDLILVETEDNCKKGCPACSRVCPENAILFPGHKSSAIAGADGEVAGLKIDLSKLFGAESSIDLAVKERDRELIADGRSAVGKNVGLPKRREKQSPSSRNHLDDLIDSLDEMPL